MFLLVSRLISIAAPEFAEILRKDGQTSLRDSSFDLESYAFRARLFLDRKNLNALFSQRYDAGYLNQAEHYLLIDGILDDATLKAQFPGTLKSTIQSTLYTLSELQENAQLAVTLSGKLLADGWNTYAQSNQ